MAAAPMSNPQHGAAANTGTDSKGQQQQHGQERQLQHVTVVVAATATSLKKSRTPVGRESVFATDNNQ